MTQERSQPFLSRAAHNLRAYNWTAAVIELAIVVLGIFLGIQASNWNEARAEGRRTALIVDGLRQDMRDGIGVEQKAVAAVDGGLAGFEAARSRGERPVPFVFRFPGSRTPPNTIWEAALQSGLADLVDPNLLFDLGFFYSERQGLGARYVDYSRFVEERILPYADDPPQFYDGKGALKPEYAANLDRLREWRSYVSVTIKTAQCLEARFANPSEPGRSCRPDYSRFWPDPPADKRSG